MLTNWGSDDNWFLSNVLQMRSQKYFFSAILSLSLSFSTNSLSFNAFHVASMLRFVLCSSSLIYSRSQQHGTEIELQLNARDGWFWSSLLWCHKNIPKAAVKSMWHWKFQMFLFWGEVGNFSLAQHIYMERKQHEIAFQGYMQVGSLRLRDLFFILVEFSFFLFQQTSSI